MCKDILGKGRQNDWQCGERGCERQKITEEKNNVGKREKLEIERKRGKLKNYRSEV